MLRLSAALLATMSLAGTSIAQATTISTNTGQYSGLGSNYSGIYDQVTLGATINTFTDTLVSVTLSLVTFSVGDTGDGSRGNYSGIIKEFGLINGQNFSFNIPYTLNVSFSVDTITLGSVGFSADGFNFLTNAITLATAGTTSGNLTATVSGGTSVPEPASLALLGMGVVGIAAARRMRLI